MGGRRYCTCWYAYSMHCNEPNKLENHKSILFIDKTSTSVLFLEFRYFEVQNIDKRIPSPIKIPIFSSELASSFIDSGVGLVLSSYVVRSSCSIEHRKQIYSCEANGIGCGVVYCNYNEQTNHLRVYRCLLTNRLHGKAAELRILGLTAGITE